VQTSGAYFIGLSHTWPSGVIRIGLPSIKVKKMVLLYENVRGAKGCKWSSLNAPGTQTPLSHPVLELEEFPFSILGLRIISLSFTATGTWNNLTQFYRNWDLE